MYNKEVKELEKVVGNYFQGIYQGDVSLLASAFHHETHLFGDINGTEYAKSLEDYLQGVKGRKSPQELGEAFKMSIIGIEVLGNVAIAKLHLPMLGFNYYDYLSLTKIDAKWKIVNKVFTHVA